MSKNISISEEAYEILASHKGKDESFTDVILREMSLALDGPELLAALRKIYQTEKDDEKPASGQ